MRGKEILFAILLAGCVRGGFERTDPAPPMEGGSAPDVLLLEASAPDLTSNHDLASNHDLSQSDVSLVPYQSNLGDCTGCNLATQSCVGDTTVTGYGPTCVDQPATDLSCTYTDGNHFRQCVYTDQCDGWQFCYNNAYAPCQQISTAAKSKMLKTYGDSALDCIQ